MYNCGQTSAPMEVAVVDMDRRGFLALTGAAAGSVLLAACTGGGSSGGGGSSSGSLAWWDQFQPIAPFEKKLFADFAKDKGGAAVKYTVQNPATFPRELQLAFQSKQLPDVFTAATNGVPSAALLKAGWFQPLALDQAHQDMLPPGTLVEGLNMFDGKPYSFPIFSFRSHDCLFWFNKDLFTKAGLDPEQPPTTYDDVRAAARTVKKSGGAAGWIAPLKLTTRLNAQIIQLAAAAGAPVSMEGISYSTGDYAFDTQHFVDAVEFWVAMRRDGVLFPASTSLDARTARARWATGVAGIFFDGSYNVGVIKGNFAPFLPKVGVGPIPVPTAGTPISISGQPANASVSLWIAKTSRNGDVASRLVSMFATDEVQKGVAEAMDQPPLVSSVLATADVEPVYRKAVALLNDEVYAGPIPAVRKPEITKVSTNMRPVVPDLGTVVAGAVSGDISDYKGALKKLTDAMNTERDRAIKAAGVSVSSADWVFPDWKPGQDYQTK